ncbi:Small-conductance mechanosensitive channel [Micromonospora nigra]|uniref:Small-conductance mechanosensitive channel n=2 Tax=Micromonospora nigra TaxID=145857 RepID=A0A1C6S817_9ACTN|nr:Small-conductance mechanosensitive channel [Micromonospora nigra]
MEWARFGRPAVGKHHRMDAFLDLVRDNSSVGGRLVTTAMLVVVAILVGSAAARLAGWRVTDAYARYYVRKATHYATVLILLVALAVLWRPFAGRIGVVLGFVAAGLAFAMQEVIGALAGWVSIMTSRQFRVGDRIQMGGVRGDVLDITPLRTTVLEIGSGSDDSSWVRGRQYTGRTVSISNKAVFSEPVYNSTATMQYLWEELTLTISYRDDWQQAERILREEAQRASSSLGARQAIEQMRRRYPVGRTEVDPRVFVRATDNWIELSARFVVPVREARAVKDTVTRTVLHRLEKAGITIASATQEVTVRQASGDES